MTDYYERMSAIDKLFEDNLIVNIDGETVVIDGQTKPLADMIHLIWFLQSINQDLQDVIEELEIAISTLFPELEGEHWEDKTAFLVMKSEEGKD